MHRVLERSFQSLQQLCICINTEKDMQYVALWVTACIALHSFAMDHEDDGSQVAADDFYVQGLKIIEGEKTAEEAAAAELLAEDETQDAAIAAGQYCDVDVRWTDG